MDLHAVFNANSSTVDPQEIGSVYRCACARTRKYNVSISFFRATCKQPRPVHPAASAAVPEAARHTAPPIHHFSQQKLPDQ